MRRWLGARLWRSELLLAGALAVPATLIASAAAGQGADQPDDARSRLERITRGELPLPAPTTADPMAPAAPSAQVDAATQKAYLAALREYYAYRSSGLEHRRRVFVWQLLSSKIIFVTVLLLVFAGIYFAAVQFHLGLKSAAAPATTEIVASVKEIKVTSPVLGVIILVLSLAFFYCYLVYVYPIEELF